MESAGNSNSGVEFKFWRGSVTKCHYLHTAGTLSVRILASNNTNSGVERYRFWRGAGQFWRGAIKFWRGAVVIQLCYTDTAYGCILPTLMLHRCSIWLHRACTYAAQGQHVAAWRLQLYCTGPPDGCIGPATMLHRASRWLHGACNSAAQGQHVACNYAAHVFDPSMRWGRCQFGI